MIQLIRDKNRLPLFLEIVFLSIIFPVLLLGQITFERCYGGTDDDRGFSVCETYDGNYTIAGYTESFGSGYSDVYLIKTNLTGDTLWTKTYGGIMKDYGYSVCETSDSGYIIAGYIGYIPLYSRNWYNVYLIKTTSEGDTLWTKNYGSTYHEYGYSICETNDEGFIIVGWSDVIGPGWACVYILKTDSLGEQMWTKYYGGDEWDFGNSICETSEGGYIVAGQTNSFGAGGFDVYLLRIDSSGDTLWTKTYGGINDDIGYSICKTSDEGYIITGYTSSFGAGWEDVYLVKIDSVGDTVWTRTYGGTDYDRGYSVCETSDSGYIIGGWTRSFGEGSGDMYLIKTDAFGDTLWTRTFGSVNYDQGLSVQETSDGGYIITGYTASFGAGNYDVYLVKTDEFGNVGIKKERNSLPKIACAELFPARPNPFREKTIISYELKTYGSTLITLKIYDTVGRLVKTLVNKKQKTGSYSVICNGKNERGRNVKSGIYFCNLRIENYKENISKRIILIR